jgi:hypothetical protein
VVGRAVPFICFHVVSGLQRSSSPERRDLGRQEQVTVDYPQNPASSFLANRGYHLTRRSFPSNGRAPEVARRGPRAIGDLRRLPERRSRPALVQDPSPPSRATCGPPRRLLVLLLQQQLDALSDE